MPLNDRPTDDEQQDLCSDPRCGHPAGWHGVKRCKLSGCKCTGWK